MANNQELIAKVAERLQNDARFAQQIESLLDGAAAPTAHRNLPPAYVAEAQELGFDVDEDGELWEGGGRSACIDTKALRRKHGLE
jgi:hypothetical protein